MSDDETLDQIECLEREIRREECGIKFARSE